MSIMNAASIILVITLMFSIPGCSKSKSPLKEIRDITSLSGIKDILQEELGGIWEIKNNRLSGHKGDSEKDFKYAYNIIPNPKNSEEGISQAGSVLFTWCSVQRVFAFSDRFIMFSTGKVISDRELQVSKILNMQIVNPPQYFRDFVEQHCECTWDQKQLRLIRNESKQSGQTDIH